MNGAALSRVRRVQALLPVSIRIISRIISAHVPTIFLIALFGCGSKESIREHAVEPAIIQPAPLAPSKSPEDPAEINKSSEAKFERLEGSGETVWAKGLAGKLVAGIDGGLYEPYHPAAIERVQRALKNRDLYAGPINGILDAPTMRAVYAFQLAASSLQLCGVPTPRTRWMLEQGSHTDPAS